MRMERERRRGGGGGGGGGGEVCLRPDSQQSSALSSIVVCAVNAPPHAPLPRTRPRLLAPGRITEESICVR